MKKPIKLLDLHLFDGSTGGAGGAEGGSGGAESGNIAHSPAGGQNGVQYHEDQSGQSETDANPGRPSFDDLIKGEYKSDYDARVKAAIDRRFKNQADFESQLKAYDDGLAPLYDKYGIDYADREGLLNAVKNDDTIYDDLAYEQGLTPEQYRRMKELERSEKEHQAMLAEQERERQAREQYDAWFEEGEKLKELYPNFNLENEVTNPDFIRDLASGKSVRKAYEAAHLEEIIGGALQRTAESAARGAIENVRSRGMRPSENGIASRPGVNTKTSVKDMSDAEFDALIQRAKRGEIIRL